MKRKLAFLTLLLLALSVALTACNQVVPTDIKIRWDKGGEDHTFEISLADFDNEISFKSYEYNKSTYYKDVIVNNEVFSTLDEIRPSNATGTYKLSITPSPDGEEYCDVNATQVLYVQYLVSNLGENGLPSELQSYVVSGDDNPFDDSADHVTLKSTTTTKVQFANIPSQQPISSSTEVNGFYLGKTFKGVSHYKVSTVYDFDGKTPTATVTLNDGDAVEYQLPKNSAGKIIDSNQILVYLRSFEKTSTSFQDSPSIYVFDPYTHLTQTASFGFTYEQNLILHDSTRSDDNELYTKLSVVGVAVGGHAFIVAENLPARLNALDLDKRANGDSKYTTVRFRVGYLAYEVAGYDDAIWEGLKDSGDKAD